MISSLSMKKIQRVNESKVLFGKFGGDYMSPTKYCNAIQCTNCEYYAECLEYEVESNELKGKSLTEIKAIINMED